LLSSISDEAKLIGAVNTVKVSGAKLEGFNTDGRGFIKHLTADLKFDPRAKTIAILGAGGAARAVSVSLCLAGVKRIGIFDVETAKLQDLAGHLKKNFKNTEIVQAASVQSLDIPKADLLINATPIGMKEQDPLLVPQGLLQENTLVYDLIYNPKETKLLAAAIARGAKVSNGLGMLLYQGVESFKIWTNREPPVKIMQEALAKGAKNK